MNKRSFLKSLAGQKTNKTFTSPTPVTTLSPYTGPWGRAEAVHLLSRCTFGPTIENIRQCEQEGLNATLNRLFEEKAPYDPPITYKVSEVNAPIGQTWYNTNPDSSVNNVLGNRTKSLRSWFIEVLRNHDMSIKPKMMFMWHEHFAMGNISRAGYLYHAMKSIENHALGNFKTLTEEITINPAMLVYLNGDTNTLESPNENYARELLELFTIGRGDDVGNGDYTNFTETDVFAIARALTGWRPSISDEGVIGSYFTADRHDTDTKQLSHRFDNIVIENEGENEYKKVIDIIFEKQEVARFICRQIHIWFINAHITEDVENNIIEPLAQMIYDNDFEVEEAVRTLIASEYFHDSHKRGCIAKSPMDHLLGLVNTIMFKQTEDIVEHYHLNEYLNLHTARQGMEVMNLPSVAGWKAYYQAPLYYRIWASAINLMYKEFLYLLFSNGFQFNGIDYGWDMINYIGTMENTEDPDLLLHELCSYLFVLPISQNKLDPIKTLMVAGLPNGDWAALYNGHIADPQNEDLKNTLTGKLKILFRNLLKLPEYYLT